jgi:aryl-alcohol dehydrogenase-like predicted oxidoreductase
VRPWQVLGMGLKDLPRDQIIVATKVGRYGAETFDFSADRVVRSVHESLQRLQLSYIDVIQCHDIEFGDLEQVRVICLRSTLLVKSLQALGALLPQLSASSHAHCGGVYLLLKRASPRGSNSSVSLPEQ